MVLGRLRVFCCGPQTPGLLLVRAQSIVAASQDWSPANRHALSKKKTSSVSGDRSAVLLEEMGAQTPCLMSVRSTSTAADLPVEWETAKNYEDIPGPKPLPLIGNIWRFIPIIGNLANTDLNHLINLLTTKYGKIYKLSGLIHREDIVFVSDPSYTEIVLRNEGIWPIREGGRPMRYYREELRKDFFKGTYGTLMSQGKAWQDFRTKVNQIMMQPRNAKLYVGAMDDVADEFLNRLRELRNAQGELPAELMEHLNKWSLESIVTIALDTRLGCLSPNLQKDSEPMKMIKAVQRIFDLFYELEMKPSPRHFTKRKEWPELVEISDFFNSICMKYINQAIELIKNQPVDPDRELSILQKLLKKYDDPMVACVMALDMIGAGIDTTSITTAFALHHLARNREKQDKVFQELKNILPSKDQKITSSDLDQMKYMKAALKESMRLTPTASANARRTVKRLVLGNYRIPEGVDVVMCHKIMTNSEEHFEKPKEFIPERWLKGDPQEQKANPFVMLPFGYGPRSCLGRRLAELEMEVLIAKIIRNFEVTYENELVIRTKIFNNIASPLNFKLEDRTQ